MSDLAILILLTFAFLIVAGLAFKAFRMTREVGRRRKAQRLEMLANESRCLDSLQVIGRALLADQMDVVEGCLRARVMIGHVDPALFEDPELSVIVRVSDETAHLHTHQARAALSPRARLDEDRCRIRVADEHHPAVMVAARRMAMRLPGRFK